MPSTAGLFGEDVRCLFVILLVFLHLNTVTPLSLSANESHSPLKEGDLRLMGSYSDNRGRVEVYHSGEWGTVCDDGWGLTDAHVVCRQLGYSAATSAHGHAFFGRGRGPIHYDNVACTGSESRLADCSHRRNVHNCHHSEDAGVVCDTTREGDLRLMGGDSESRGRVEVYHSGEWGTVCDDDWDLTDAHVVCRQLGYSAAISAHGHAFFGRGRGPIHYDNVACNGSETCLADCSHPGIGVEDCDHDEDAGVACSTMQDADNTTHVPKIENLQEVTTVNDSLHNVVAFSFDLFTGDVNISSADNSAIFQLRWETANKGTSGLITPTVTKCRGFNQTNHTTDGTVTYHFTVDATALGEGPLLVALSAKMHCSRYRSSYCNRHPHSRCTCSQWQYGAESETIKIGAKKGDFDIISFRDITIDSAFNNNTAVFEFQFDPMVHLNTTLGYDLRLTWSQVSGQSSGVIEGAVCRYYRQRNAQLERVGYTGTYRLYVPIRLLGDGRLLVNLTINMSCIGNWYWYPRGQCGCSDWQVRGTSESLEISAKRGPVTIVNLRDITTQSDLMDENAVFAFDTHLRISSTAALGYRVQIQWSQLGMQFGSYNGTHTVYLPPEGPRNCRGTANTTLELVGAGSYKLTVPTAVFDSGPLFINMSVSLVCLQLTSNSCPLCSQWRYTGQASIDISAKRDFENTSARIENFKEVTTVDESALNVVVFSFDLFTSDLNISIDDRVINNGIFQLRWETADNSSTGLIPLIVIKGRGFNQANHTTEGAVTYHFTVNATALGEGPLLLTLFTKLQCFLYRRSHCNLNPQHRCTCAQWQYEAESETILISAKKGDFDVINFIDITAESDLDNTAIFQFEFDPVTHLNTSFGYALRLTWSQVSGPASGRIEAANCRLYQSNGQLERVRHTGTYRLYVPLHFFGEGRLLVRVSISISCSKYQYKYSYRTYRYECDCNDWQIRGISDSLEISAKRGDFDVINFRDVTTDSAFNNNTAIFEFQFDPVARLNTSFGYDLRLTWSQVSGRSSGVIEAANCKYYKRPNAKVEQIGHTGTYRLYVPIRLLGDGRLLVNLTINMSCIGSWYWRRGQCGCSDWQVRGTSESLEISSKRGPVTIVNLRDITTQSDLNDKNAVFAFDTHPKISPIVAFGYQVQIQWSQLGIEFGSYNGTHTVYLPPGSTRHCRGTSKITLELLGTGSYKMTVPTAVFDSGPLSMNVSVSLACLELQSRYYCSTCSQWRYTSQASSSIDISAKRGSLAPFEVDLKLWPKEQCFEAADAIKASDISTLLVKSIRDNTDNMADTSHLQVYGERYLCERKGYLSFRGVLVKLYDFLATKNRDTLGDWLKGGARHIVVAERQMNIKEGACGIALTSLEEPPCDKSARRG